MSIFKHKNKPTQTPEIFPYTDDDINRIWEYMKEKTAQSAFNLTLNTDRVPTLFDTKIGGVPYWDKNLEIPKNKNNEKFALLAQLNMNDFKNNNILPSTGILQFFITADDIYGMSDSDLTEQTSFKVVYHENIDTTVTVDDVRANFITPEDVETECYDLPIRGEYALDVENIVSYMCECNFRFMDVLKQTLVELRYATPEEVETYNDSLGDDRKDRTLWKILGRMPDVNSINTGHRVLGYPHFTQSDIRYYKSYENYDILLFQLDSDLDDCKIMWGDAGVANFFIKSADLKNKDFSKVAYSWDCC